MYLNHSIQHFQFCWCCQLKLKLLWIIDNRFTIHAQFYYSFYLQFPDTQFSIIFFYFGSLFQLYLVVVFFDMLQEWYHGQSQILGGQYSETLVSALNVAHQTNQNSFGVVFQFAAPSGPPVLAFQLEFFTHTRSGTALIFCITIFSFLAAFFVFRDSG